MPYIFVNLYKRKGLLSDSEMGRCEFGLVFALPGDDGRLYSALPYAIRYEYAPYRTLTQKQNAASLLKTSALADRITVESMFKTHFCFLAGHFS